jgi:hypothetical protein
VLSCVAIFVVERVLALPGTMRFCLAIVSRRPSAPPCPNVLAFWPEAVGIALAYQLVHWWRVADGSGNPLLEAAGSLALAQNIAASILGALLVTTSALESGLLVLAAAAVGGVGAGSRSSAASPSHVRGSLIIVARGRRGLAPSSA